ncbi:hypothetical protein LNTAR_02654, partial [Lentisphaera araneosa HTCC2155]
TAKALTAPKHIAVNKNFFIVLPLLFMLGLDNFTRSKYPPQDFFAETSSH